jgi:hypothetical protein
MWGHPVDVGGCWFTLTPRLTHVQKKKPQAPLKWQREGVMSYLFGNTQHEWGPPSFNDEKHDLSIYEGRKEGSLFCFVLFCRYEIHQTRMLQIVFLVSLESSLTMEGAFGLVPWCLALWCKSSWLSMCGVEVKKHNIRVVPSLVVLYYGLHDRWKTMQVTKHNRLYRNIELMMGYDGTQKSVIYDV